MCMFVYFLFDSNVAGGCYQARSFIVARSGETVVNIRVWTVWSTFGFDSSVGMRRDFGLDVPMTTG